MGGLRPGAGTALAKWMPARVGGVAGSRSVATGGTVGASTLEWQNWQLLQTLLAGSLVSLATLPAASAASPGWAAWPWQGAWAAFSEENPAAAPVEWT